MDVKALLEEAVLRKASDIHLTVGSPPIYRLNGRLEQGADYLLSEKDLESIFLTIADSSEQEKFNRYSQVDFCYDSGCSRYRVNAFRQRGSIALAVRIISDKIPTIEALGLPDIIKDFTRRPSGLVLVAGSTGSGKSTTLAAMIDFINNERACHVITIEDPIEYWHKSNKSIINQRQIGKDAGTFQKALTAALRQDPDVILVGEMRDAKTIEVTITAAETGHLVLATLHTKDAASSVGRIIDAFAPHQRDHIQSQLSNVLEGVIAQRLLPEITGRTRVAATEIMVATPAVRNIIREGKTHQLYSAIQTGASFGMQTMEASLQDLYRRGVIAYEVIT